MTTALLVVDVQNGVIAGEQPSFQTEQVLANIASLIDQARTTQTPLVFIQHSEPIYLEVGSDEWQIHPAVAPAAGEPVVGKLVGNSFSDTPLDDMLRSQGVDHLVIAGCQTNYCINSTVRGAVELGYKVTLAGDAHTTVDEDVPAEQLIAEHNAALGDLSAVAVAPTAEISFAA